MKTQFAVSSTILLFLAAAHAAPREEVMQNGGFEQPAVKVRTSSESGGSPVNGGVQSLWQTFSLVFNPAGGALSAGLTSEIAHTGAQALFVKFNNVSLSYQSANLVTAPVPVVQSSPYRLSLWGRLDKKDPLTMGERPAYLKIEIDYLKEDGETASSDPEYRIQQIPGSKNRAPLFTPDKWNEFAMDINTPADTAFLVVSLKFETGPTPGKANGVILIDDFSIQGEASPLKVPKPKPEETPETTGTSD